MAWTRDTRGIEVLDLTSLSSSPEPAPRQSTYPSSASVNPKRNNAHTLTSNQKPKQEPHQAPSPNPRPSAPTIDPGHLARIIDTSNPQHVKNVLLHLCKLSPALSGAVARGLAQHSTFAQGLVRQHQHATAGSSNVRPKREDRPSGLRVANDANERSDKIPGLMSTAPRHGVLKREREPSITGSDASASSGFGTPPPPLRRMPGSFPDGKAGSKSTGEFYQGPSTGYGASSSRESILARSSSRPSSIKSERASTPSTKICQNCKSAFREDAMQICSYHPGKKMSLRGPEGKVIDYYGCCNRSDSKGCKFGRHIGQPSSVLSKRPPSFYESSPFNETYKNPKLR